MHVKQIHEFSLTWVLVSWLIPFIYVINFYINEQRLAVILLSSIDEKNNNTSIAYSSHLINCISRIEKALRPYERMLH